MRQPSGYVDNTDDCDDDEPEAWSGAEESCDEVDNDCDGTADEDASDASTWYADADGDGYTDPDDSVTACDAPSGYAEASDSEDCDDEDPDAYPGADDTPGDGIDQDCDGSDAVETDTDASDTESDTDAPDTDPEDKEEEDDGASCATGVSPTAAAWLGLLVLARRRSR